MKAGAFFPTISLENDDLGWTSPYTLTPSAINSWIGEELRTIGSEAILRYDTNGFGTVSLTGARDLLQRSRWRVDGRARLGDGRSARRHLQRPASARCHIAPLSPDAAGRTPMFDEIDGRPGWYAGLTWQMAGVGKLSVLRYDNEGDPNKVSGEYPAWDTRFWSYGARTGWDELVLIAQGLQGQTVIGTRSGLSYTFFQSGFLLASYDLRGVGAEDWRASVRGDVFATRHPAATPSIMNEDGHAATVAPVLAAFRLAARHRRDDRHAIAPPGISAGRLSFCRAQPAAIAALRPFLLLIPPPRPGRSSACQSMLRSASPVRAQHADGGGGRSRLSMRRPEGEL